MTWARLSFSRRRHRGCCPLNEGTILKLWSESFSVEWILQEKDGAWTVAGESLISYLKVEGTVKFLETFV